MNDDNYTNREIDGKFDTFAAQQNVAHAKLQNSINEVKEIAISTLEQAKKTNGTVASLKLWRAYITGATALLGFILAVGIPLLVILLRSK